MIPSHIESYINKFKNHLSITFMKFRKKKTFASYYVCYEEGLAEIMKLQTAKTTQQNDIPTKILKENPEVFLDIFMKT